MQSWAWTRLCDKDRLLNLGMPLRTPQGSDCQGLDSCEITLAMFQIDATSDSQDRCSLEILAVTANVHCAIGDGSPGNVPGSDAYFRKRFAGAGARVVRIQDGFAKNELTIVSSDYLRFVAGPQDREHGDVGLWFN